MLSGTGMTKSDAAALREKCLYFLLEQLKVLLMTTKHCESSVLVDSYDINFRIHYWLHSRDRGSINMVRLGF